MAIVRMKHGAFLTLSENYETLINEFSRLGFVEISKPDCNSFGFNTIATENEQNYRQRLGKVKSAMDAIYDIAKVKTPLFNSKGSISIHALYSEEFLQEGEQSAEEILKLLDRLNGYYNEIARLNNTREALSPWASLDVPLETVGFGKHSVLFGVMPNRFDISAVFEALLAENPDVYIVHASSDRDQHYIFAISHMDDFEALLKSLKQFSFSSVSFKGQSGTAASNIKRIEDTISEIKLKQEEIINTLKEHKANLKKLELSYDILSYQLEKASVEENLLASNQTIYFTGWFPAAEMKKLIEVLDKYLVSYDFRDPLPDELVPTFTHNPKMISPFGTITNMYSPPSYGEVDPNPFVSLFFTIFFGIMLADIAYGIILISIGLFVLLKYKPKGGVRDFMMLAVICGISTAFFGATFGSFFGDSIPSFYKMFTGNEFNRELALWFNPLSDPMKMLLFCFILGAVQIFVGMAVKAWLLIRDGKWFDAIFDVGSWWVFLTGIVCWLVGVKFGMQLTIIGAAMLILTQGRSSKNIFGKLIGGVLSLYDITGYMSDVLSYSRLLALSLSSGVIAAVINTMGALTGAVGVVFVFIIGHSFNLGISLIGTYVHSARLQYVEFFGKFYSGGGELFNPITIKTKYNNIKEDF